MPGGKVANESVANTWNILFCSSKAPAARNGFLPLRATSTSFRVLRRGVGQLPDLGWVFTAETIAGALSVTELLQTVKQPRRLSGCTARGQERREAVRGACAPQRAGTTLTHTPHRNSTQVCVCVLYGGTAHWSNKKHGCHNYIEITRLCFEKIKIMRWNYIFKKEMKLYISELWLLIFYFRVFISLVCPFTLVFDCCLTVRTFYFISKTFNL